MKIFVKTGVAPESINFVDEQNRVLGWNASQICCEEHSCVIYDWVDMETKELVITDTDCMSEKERELYASGKEVRRVYNKIKPRTVIMNLDMISGSTIDLPSFMIDPDYFMEDNGSVVFRLVGESKWGGKRELFVVMENLHNGYYAHGFSLSVGGVKKVSGIL